MTDVSGPPSRLFVYGTLMPRQPRWRLLAPLTTSGDPEHAEAAGYLYRTPHGWPAAVFDLGAPVTVPGVVVVLHDPGAAFPVLDAAEGTDAGLFERRLIESSLGQCWAYHWPGRTTGFKAITRWPAG